MACEERISEGESQQLSVGLRRKTFLGLGPLLRHNQQLDWIAASFLCLALLIDLPTLLHNFQCN